MEKLSNFEMEQRVLGCLFLDKEAVEYCLAALEPYDFAVARHQEIFITVGHLHAQGSVIDQLTVRDELKSRQKLQATGDFEYIMKLSESMPTTAQLHSYVETLLEYSKKRRLSKLSVDLKVQSNDLTTTTDFVIAETRKKLEEIEACSPVRLSNAVADTMDYLDTVLQARNYPELTPRIYTGYAELDRLLQGLKPGSFNILAARPSMGKTALALNIAVNAAKNEGMETKNVLFLTLEMDRTQINNRIGSFIAGINHGKVQQPELLSEAEFAALCDGMYRVMDLGLKIHWESGLTLDKLRQLLYEIHRQHKVDLLIIDYLQQMVTDSRDDSYTRATKISNGLKAMAMEFKMPILALSQLNRSVEGRAVKKPMLSDLRDSGSLEQDADVVLLLNRMDYYEKSECKTPGIAELEIAKARNGATGKVQLFFEKSCGCFLDMS